MAGAITLLASYFSDETKVEVYRTESYPATPYGVRMIDRESGIVLQTFKFFQTEDAARSYAAKSITF